MNYREVYFSHVERSLPRLLALFDHDKSSDSAGVGDRYYWAWGLIDFPNGTFQGAANGLARLWQTGLWPYPTSDQNFMSLVGSIFHGARFCTRSNGSLEEAFPNEGSYCVTALAAFDLLVAADLLDKDSRVDAPLDEWLSIIEPMIDYLIKSEETHAIISNHLATAVAAMVRWHSVTNDDAALAKARQLMDRILSHQSDEGWFEEYGGADPGYQTLCLHYLADVHRRMPDWQLLSALQRSLRFLWHFAHPDGSFGGVYGSRCTRFYYPSGILALASETPEARALADYMAASISRNRVVTLASMDEPNLIPMFNSYCWAAELARHHESDVDVTVPAVEKDPTRVHFPHAGLIIDRGGSHYTVVSTHKGGTVDHFVDGDSMFADAGILVRDNKGRLGSSQAFAPDNAVEISDESVVVRSQITRMAKRLPTPVEFLLLRVLCSTVFRIPWFREWTKRVLARILITGSSPWPAHNRRTIRFGKNIDVRDETSLPDGYERVHDVRDFVAIHMASQGYWQIQDEESRQ